MRTAASATPLVSVITPVYNGRSHVAECIESVARALTFGQIVVEHILIDDGSSDDSVAVIEAATSAFASQGYSGRLLRFGHSGRPAYARNRAIEAARGKYVFCLDHDDLLVQNALRYLAGHLERAGGEVVYGDFLRFDEARGYVVGDDYYGWPHPNSASALYSIFRGEHFYQHSFMFTRRLWSLVGGYDDALTYGEDLDLCTRFILHGHVPVHLPVTTHVHRNHGRNLTAGRNFGSPEWLAEWRAHYRKYASELRHHLAAVQIHEIEHALGLSEAALADPLQAAGVAGVRLDGESGRG
jgi:glycosyltransferase involved in cell wall biosynthesis